MLRGIIVAVLIFSMVVVLTAQNDGLSREELQQRRAQLNAQADQIRREARFQGKISNDPERNRITWLEGRFRDITFPALDDTLGIERAFDEIVDRIMPFFPVNREDLEIVNLGIKEHRIIVTYRQTANGYRIEGGALLRLTFYPRRESVYINNGLTYLDPSVLPTEPRITREEAARIFEDNVGKPAGWAVPGDGSILLYCRVRNENNIPTNEFRLSWRIGNLKRVLMIDAITGEVIGGTTALRYGSQKVQGE